MHAKEAGGYTGHVQCWYACVKSGSFHHDSMEYMSQVAGLDSLQAALQVHVVYNVGNRMFVMIGSHG